MPNMYDGTPTAPTAEKDTAQATKAALWTDAAQQRYAELSNLPDSAQALARMEIGYLEEAKNAAERKGL